jgi:hypothetical protein
MVSIVHSTCVFIYTATVCDAHSTRYSIHSANQWFTTYMYALARTQQAVQWRQHSTLTSDSAVLTQCAPVRAYTLCVHILILTVLYYTRIYDKLTRLRTCAHK